ITLNVDRPLSDSKSILPVVEEVMPNEEFVVTEEIILVPADASVIFVQYSIIDGKLDTIINFTQSTKRLNGASYTVTVDEKVFIGTIDINKTMSNPVLLDIDDSGSKTIYVTIKDIDGSLINESLIINY